MTIYTSKTNLLPVQKGAAAAGGGTFVSTLLANVLAIENTYARIQIEVYLSEAIASVLTNAAAFLGECVILNKAGVVTFAPAIATSSNPVNSNTAGFALTSRPIASDAAFNTATAVLTIDGGGNLLCTVTNNNGGGIAADVTIVARITLLSVLSGILVDTWQDQSGAGDPNRDFTQSNTQRPTWVGSDPRLNGQPSVQFARNPPPTLSTRMTQVGAPSNAPIVQPYTIIMVGYDNASLLQAPWLGDSTQNNWYLSSTTALPSCPPPVFGSSIGPVTGFANLGTLVTDTQQSVIYMAEFNDPSSSTIRINSDAALPLQWNGSLGADGFTLGGNLPDVLSLGWAIGTGQNLTGAIGEIIIFGGLLSNADREGIETYLQNRYNLAVAGLPVVAPILPTAVLSAPLQAWFRADLGIVPTP
jgi:hypothetical protein